MTTKPCLLVVDDEPDLVQSVQDLLRFEYRVLGATRAREGLRILQNERVHIIMTDQRMPEMTGVELLRQVKESHPEIVRLLFTAYADLHAVIEAINQGCVYRYVAKPWEVADLKATLRQAYDYYQLQEERRLLLREVQATNEQLARANAELSKANEAKKAFIKVASHELRTPLTILLGLSEHAARATSNAPELNALVQRILRAGGRLHHRVDQMVKLLLADSFDRPLQRTQVDAQSLIQSALAEVNEFVQARQQKLEASIAKDLGSLNVDPEKIRDSLTQLLFNAVKFTSDGGAIRVAADRSDDSILRITVADSGMGIEPDCLAQIFEPFFTRYDVSRHSSGTFEYDKRGLGLGLTVAKAFIEMHGGTLTVESTLGQGTVFAVQLPTGV